MRRRSRIRRPCATACAGWRGRTARSTCGLDRRPALDRPLRRRVDGPSGRVPLRRVVRELSLASLELHAELAAAGLETSFVQRARSACCSRRAPSRAEAGSRGVPSRGRAGGGARAWAGARARARALGRAGRGRLLPGRRPLRSLPLRPRGRPGRRRGGRARLHAVEVLALRRGNGRVEGIQTTAGDVRAGTVVMAAGAWSPPLARGLGIYMPIEGGKGYHVDLEPPPATRAGPCGPGEPGHCDAASRPLAPGRDAGARRARRERQPARVEAIVKAARKGIAGLDGRRVLEVWRGLRPCTPDGLPLVGRSETPDNLVLASGHAMMGLTLAPVTGRLVGEIVAGEEPSHDLASAAAGPFPAAARTRLSRAGRCGRFRRDSRGSRHDPSHTRAPTRATLKSGWRSGVAPRSE